MGKEIFLALDLGTEAVKCLVCKKENSEIIVLGTALQYFEEYGVFDGRVFGMDVVKKAILKAIEGAYDEFVVSSEKEKIPGDGWRNWPLLVGLPPDILKARVVEQSFRRDEQKKKISKKEQECIYQQVLKQAQQEVSQRFTRDSGILANELQWISSKILARKIDGYLVARLQGYQGQNLEFKILAIFSPKYYFETIKRVFGDLGLRVLKIMHIAENLPPTFSGSEKVGGLPPIAEEGLFFDVGGEVSQIFSIRGGSLEQIKEFKGGGKMFSQKLSETLGISEESARVLKERYAKGLLSQESRQRIREMFLEEKRKWSKDLKRFLCSNIFLFGGGSLLPEIQESLPGAKLLDLGSLAPRLPGGQAQYIPALLIAYAKEVF